MELESFKKSNIWFDVSTHNIHIKHGLFVTSSIEFVKDDDLALDTDGEERRLKWSTMKKLLKVFPDAVGFKDSITFSKRAITINDMPNVLHDDDIIGLFNFTSRNVFTQKQQCHENTSNLALLVELFRKHCYVEIRDRLTEKVSTIFTGYNSNEDSSILLVSTPPTKCSVIVCRAVQVCAMPDELLKKLCSHTIVHYGKLSRTLPFNTIDASSFTSGDFSMWVKDMETFIRSRSA